MIGMELAKSTFFDRRAVQGAADRATLRVLSRFGAFVMRTARKSIKLDPTTSAPGDPPHGHAGFQKRRVIRRGKRAGQVKVQAASFLREFIFFAYDPALKGVVIGPVLLPGRAGRKALTSLEYGGASERKGQHPRDNRATQVRARPFMHPALDAELGKMPAMFKGTVVSGERGAE